MNPALAKEPVVKAGKGKVTELKVTELVAGKGPKLQPGQTARLTTIGVDGSNGAPRAR